MSDSGSCREIEISQIEISQDFLGNNLKIVEKGGPF